MTTVPAPTTSKNPNPNPAPETRSLLLTAIRVDPSKNARTVMNEDAIDELAKAMKLEGQLQAVRVEATNKPGEYDLVFGFRRYAAAQKLGWTELRAEIVPQMEPVDRFLANLAENMGRENLTTYDQAQAFLKLQKAHEMTGVRIANSVGKSTPYVNNLIRISEGLADVILDRWKAECSPNFGRDKDTGKKLPNIHTVCNTEWLGKLVARVPKAEQERELKIALGLINPDEEEDDTSDSNGGDSGSGKPATDAPRRVTMKMLERALAAAEAKVKEAKGEDLIAARVVVSTIKWAMGKSQSIKAIGWTNPKPGEEPTKPTDDKAKGKDNKKN